jgi:hypothetical protein
MAAENLNAVRVITMRPVEQMMGGKIGNCLLPEPEMLDSTGKARIEAPESSRSQP